MPDTISTSSSISFVTTAALLVGTILLAGLTERRIPENLAVPLDRIDSHIDGWTESSEQQLDPHTLKTLDATSYLSRAFQKDNLELGLFVAFYAQQRAGESMHSPKNCLPGSGWEIWRQDSALIPVNGLQVKVNKYSIQNLGTRMLMFYWYQSKNRIIASEYFGKILLARDTLMTGQTAASIVRVTLPDVPGADLKGIAFAAELIPEVQQCFDGTRLSRVGGLP
jgi:EpsI family protein